MANTTTATASLTVINAVGALACSRARADGLDIPGAGRGHNCRRRRGPVEGHEHAAAVRLLVDLLAEQPAEDLLESPAKLSEVDVIKTFFLSSLMLRSIKIECFTMANLTAKLKEEAYPCGAAYKH